jgi:hypothetical protein
MESMIVLTVKRDGGTQDVLGFYPAAELQEAVLEAAAFLLASLDSKRAIARIELYNPNGNPAHAPVQPRLNGAMVDKRATHRAVAPLTTEMDHDDPEPQPPRLVSPLERATWFLQRELADGPKPFDKLRRLAADSGVMFRDLYAAAKSIGLVTTWHSAIWFWGLPSLDPFKQTEDRR